MSDTPRDVSDPTKVARHRALRESASLARQRAIAIAAASHEQSQRSLKNAEHARALMDRTRARLADDGWTGRNPRDRDAQPVRDVE